MTQRVSTARVLQELISDTQNVSLYLRSKKLAERFKGIYFEEAVAREIILQAGGYPHDRPKGVPVNWMVALLPRFAMKYVNPQNKEEYVQVIPGDPDSCSLNLQITHVAYHHPNLVKNDAKDFPMNRVPTLLFDLAKHGQILDEIKKHSTSLEDRIDLATERLADYFFNLEDIQEIRKRMDFPPLEPEAIEFLGKACDCHLPVITKTGGGVITHHPRHAQFTLRASKPNFNDPTYLKIQTSRGYHTQSGALGKMQSPDTHLKIQDILTMPFHFYDPPCIVIKPFYKFNYMAFKLKLVS